AACRAGRPGSSDPCAAPPKGVVCIPKYGFIVAGNPACGAIVKLSNVPDGAAMTSSRKAKQHKPAPIPGGELDAYRADALQRACLFWDALLDRGNNYVEHLDQGMPPLLKFEHELVLDGLALPEPCNYSLLRLVPPAGTPVDAAARPVVVVDPRAGHGPGIGGFKLDSEVGMAMRAGHPVYFVTFRPEPEDGQTLFTVMQAEARFIEEVIARHPDSAGKPVVIGNCQAGWGMMAVNALRPELFGPLMMMGAPVSY